MNQVPFQRKSTDMHHTHVKGKRGPASKGRARPVAQIIQRVPRMASQPKQEPDHPPAHRLSPEPCDERCAQHHTAQADPRVNVRESFPRAGQGQGVLHIGPAFTEAYEGDARTPPGRDPLKENAGVVRKRPETGGGNQFRRNPQFPRDRQHPRAIRASVAMFAIKGTGDDTKHQIVRRSEPLGSRLVQVFRVGLPPGELSENQRRSEVQALFEHETPDIGYGGFRSVPLVGSGQQSDVFLRGAQARRFLPTKKPTSKAKTPVPTPTHSADFRTASLTTGFSNALIEA